MAQRLSEKEEKLLQDLKKALHSLAEDKFDNITYGEIDGAPDTFKAIKVTPDGKLVVKVG